MGSSRKTNREDQPVIGRSASEKPAGESSAGEPSAPEEHGRAEHEREENRRVQRYQRVLRRVIFGTDTPAGLAFDLVLIGLILLSIVAVCLESVAPIAAEYGAVLLWTEWGLTVLFGMEYLLRLFVVRRRLAYAFSFFGIVDLLAVLPSLLGLFFGGGQMLIVLRVLRMLRLFKVLQLPAQVAALRALQQHFWRHGNLILVFLYFVLTVVIVVSTLMYLVEGAAHGFTSIPRSIYWTIVTITTVGFGDITPNTVFGQFLAALLMLIGYGLIALPTGIVSARWARRGSSAETGEVEASSERAWLGAQRCIDCGRVTHERRARFCCHCGHALPAPVRRRWFERRGSPTSDA